LQDSVEQRKVEIISSFLTEILLALKEVINCIVCILATEFSLIFWLLLIRQFLFYLCIMYHCVQVNKKTRNKAYDLLVEIGHACEDANDGTRRENLSFLFNMVFFFNFFSLFFPGLTISLSVLLLLARSDTYSVVYCYVWFMPLF
jgi:hypothetical protein